MEPETASRLEEKLSGKTQLEVDLEEWEHIEQYYGVTYPVFIACLSRSINQTRDELLKTKRRVTIRETKGSLLSLSIDRLAVIKTRDGPKILSEGELPKYLGATGAD